MDNYIMVNGQKLPLTEEQVQQIMEAKEENKKTVVLSAIAPGDTFKIGDCEILVLEQAGDTTVVIKKDFLEDGVKFGESNNYAESPIRSTCEKFAEGIAREIGDENILEHTVDLTSDDGLKDYGTIKSRCSLLTADLYRRYVEILDKFKPDGWWWLATPHSTERHGNDNWVKCVSPSGYIGDFFYDCGLDGGVRPFCILKSTIFVSK